MVIFENVIASVSVHNFSGDHVVFDDADLVCLHERPDDGSRMVKIAMSVPTKLPAFLACIESVCSMCL